MSIRAQLSRVFSEFNRGTSQPSATVAPELTGPERTAGTSPLRLIPEQADGLAAPGLTHPGAASHPSQWPIDWGVVREGLANLRATFIEAVAWIDEIDPTAAGLAQAAAVTDLDAYRR